jgi:hypothetical protein
MAATEKQLRINYLPEMKDKLKKLGSPTNWVDNLKKTDLSEHEMIEMIKLKSQAIENKASMYEKYELSGHNHKAPEANNLYLDSIKAKMALIENL